MQKAKNFDDVSTVTMKRSDYRIHFSYMTKDDAIRITNPSNQNEKKWIIRIFLLYIKINGETYNQNHIDMVLKRAKDYYENDIWYMINTWLYMIIIHD